MIKHFQKWLDDKGVTRCNPEQKTWLHNNSSEINDVTAVTGVTQLNTRSREPVSITPSSEPSGLNPTLTSNPGYIGNIGYNADLKDTSPVTPPRDSRVTRVTNQQNGTPRPVTPSFNGRISIAIAATSGRALLLIKTTSTNKKTRGRPGYQLLEAGELTGEERAGSFSSLEFFDPQVPTVARKQRKPKRSDP